LAFLISYTRAGTEESTYVNHSTNTLTLPLMCLTGHLIGWSV